MRLIRKFKNLIALALIFTSYNADCQLDFSLEVYEQHEGMVGSVDLSGFTTYRLFLELSSDLDKPYLFWGDEDFPLEIKSDSGFFQSLFGGATSEQISSAYFELIPSLAFDSYVTIGAEYSNSPLGVYTVEGEQAWTDVFEFGADLQIADTIGGGFFIIPLTEFTPLPLINNKLLVAQLTTNGNLWGQMNIDYLANFTIENYTDPHTSIMGLEFGSEQGLILGCTDPNALNYSSVANVLLDCEYALGDLTGDGEIGIDDLLLFLGGIGCMEDCGDYDLNGDGVVNINDLLMILGLL